MKFLVTGSAGYIGKPTMKALLQAGHTVVPFDLPSWDILDEDALLSVFQRNRFDAVLHLAAISSVPAGAETPGACWATNVQGTINVLQAMISGGCPNLVFASSLAAGMGFRPGLPCTVYGWTKFAAEEVIKTHCRSSGINALCLRYSNVAGGRHDSWTHLIPNMIRAWRNRQPIVMTAREDVVRDFIHFEDVVRANVHFLESPRVEEGFQQVDIASGVGFRLHDVVRLFNGLMKKKGLPPLETVAGEIRKEPQTILANIGPAYNLGFEAQLDLEAIFKSAIKTK